MVIWTMIMLFGDSGSAIVLEKTDRNIEANFSIKSDGNRFKSIITPSGAYRNLNGEKSRVEWSDGIYRSDYDTHMKGMDVFGFSISDVPNLIKEFLKSLNKTADDFDYFTLHQANYYILKLVKIKFIEKHFSIEEFFHHYLSVLSNQDKNFEVAITY